MSTTFQAPLRAGELVPIAERLRLMQAARCAFAGLAMLVAWQSLKSAELSIGAFGAASCAYVALGFAAQVAFRASRRRGVAIFGAVLLLDGLYLVSAMYLTGGSASPLRYLIVIHVVAVALLASYRTGVKIALWDSLLLLVVYYAREGHLLRGLGSGDVAAGTPFMALIAFTTVLWLAAIATAHFSAVNERELRRRRYDIEALARMAEQLELTSGSRATAAVLLEHAADAFEIDRAVVLASPDGGAPRLLASRGAQDEDVEGLGAPGPRSIVTEVLKARSTRLAASLHDGDDELLASLLPGASSLVVVPLTAEGQAVGVLVVERGLQGSRIARRVVTMLERFAAYGSLALRNAWLLEQVQVMAATDGLTGLMNRGTLHDALGRELARALREGGRLSVMMLDIDHFKAVNDTYGHQAGDEVLRRVARALDGTRRAGELLGRFGGEEFVIVLPDADEPAALLAAERVRGAVADADGSPRVTASVGVATFPVDATDVDALLGAADAALYASKAAGRNRVTSARETLVSRTPG